MLSSVCCKISGVFRDDKAILVGLIYFSWRLSFSVKFELGIQQIVISAVFHSMKTLAVDLHRKFFNVRPGPIFLIFMQLLVKFGQLIGWRFPLWVGAPVWKILNLPLNIIEKICIQPILYLWYS